MTRTAIMRWLRRACWQIEDAIVDLIDWQPHRAPPLKPAPRRAPPTKPQPPTQHFANWSALGLGDQNTVSVESVDADRLRKVFEQLGTGLEIKRS